MTNGLRAFAVAATACLSLSANAAVSDKYLCVSELSTGFKWDGSQWGATTFNIRDESFIIEKTQETPPPNPSITYSLTQIGQDYVSQECNLARFFDEYSRRIICGAVMVNFILDTENLRFQHYFGIGYLDGDANAGTPNITIGRCSPLQN